MDPIKQNIEGVRQLVGSGLNKSVDGTMENQEGVNGDFFDEFTLKMEDDDLIKLSESWENSYRSYESKLRIRQEANKTYYLGKQKSVEQVSDEPISANLIFEAEETFLPAALAKNPEPVVWSDNTKEGTQVSGNVKTMLQYHADTLVLRRKLTLMTRHWSIYFIGILKHGWDKEIGDIKTEVIDPQTIILDPEASIDCYGDYTGAYLGERKKCTASELIKRFPEHKAFITIIVNGELGTKVTYTEWWTNDYCFYTFKGKVLDKNKNHLYNYNKTTKETDEDGEEVEQEEKGINHFAKPKMPYSFLTVFSLGEQPHDITGLIEQNIPNQNRVSRRTNQIDYNLSRANNSDVFSQDNFTAETAKAASVAMRKGNPVLVPSGKAISEAIHRLQAPSIGSEFFADLENSKQDLRSIYGTQGITASTPNEDQTARGMILNQQYDNSRIGGGIGDAIEQVADNVFNWWVQLYYVYYDEPHFASVMGKMKAVEYIEMTQADLNRRLIISVSPDSMKPRDEVTEMNQALDLWDRGAIDPKTLLTVLNFPDPQETAEQAVLWSVDKASYLKMNFPELAQKLVELNQGGATAPPGSELAPEQVTEPPGDLSASPASAALSSVQLPTLPQ